MLTNPSTAACPSPRPSRVDRRVLVSALANTARLAEYSQLADGLSALAGHSSEADVACCRAVLRHYRRAGALPADASALFTAALAATF